MPKINVEFDASDYHRLMWYAEKTKTPAAKVIVDATSQLIDSAIRRAMTPPKKSSIKRGIDFFYNIANPLAAKEEKQEPLPF